MVGQLACFDVDGTVMEQDSLKVLVREALRQEPWRIALLAAVSLVLAPVLLLGRILTGQRFRDPFFALRLKLRQLAKSACLWAVTFGKSRKNRVRFLLHCALPAASTRFQQIPALLAELRQQGFHVVYVSASGQLWVRALLRAMDPAAIPGQKTVLGSKLRFFCGGVALKGHNCYAFEKIHRLQQWMQQQQLPHNPPHWQKAYTDHVSDLPLLDGATERHFVVSKSNPEGALRQKLSHCVGRWPWLQDPSSFHLHHWTQP